MPIIKTINLYNFRIAFEKADRDNFSYEGLELLFNYLEAMSNESGGNIELDVLALCCGYQESKILGFIKDYNLQDEITDCDGEEITDIVELRQITKDYLEKHTSFVGFTSDDTVLFSTF